MSKFEDLGIQIKQFNSEREWGQFHSPKNLSLAICSECGELADIMRWLSDEQSDNLSPNQLKKVKEEMGDILIFLSMLSERLGIDLIEEAINKLNKNKLKYPVEISKGVANKYSDKTVVKLSDT
jgi:dCTP diphosphatase